LISQLSPTKWAPSRVISENNSTYRGEITPVTHLLRPFLGVANPFITRIRAPPTLSTRSQPVEIMPW